MKRIGAVSRGKGGTGRLIVPDVAAGGVNPVSRWKIARTALRDHVSERRIMVVSDRKGGIRHRYRCMPGKVRKAVSMAGDD